MHIKPFHVRLMWLVNALLAFFPSLVQFFAGISVFVRSRRLPRTFTCSMLLCHWRNFFSAIELRFHACRGISILNNFAYASKYIYEWTINSEIASVWIAKIEKNVDKKIMCNRCLRAAQPVYVAYCEHQYRCKLSSFPVLCCGPTGFCVNDVRLSLFAAVKTAVCVPTLARCKTMNIYVK